MKYDPLKPDLKLLIKLGSIAVHADEMLSPQAHAFDHAAIKTCLEDPDVKTWVKLMTNMAFLPLKRNP